MPEEARQTAGASLRDRLKAWAPAAALALGLAVEVGALIHHARRLWFFGDDFAFLLGRSSAAADPPGLLDPHNEHWSTLPVIAFKAMFAIFGLEHYLPYALMPIGAHVVICVVLFLLNRHLGVTPWLSTVSVLIFAFLAGGAGAEDTLWDFQIGFLGSCAFGMIALLLSAREGPAARVLAAVALIGAFMCSGIGLVMTGWVALWLLLTRGLRAALATVGVPVGVFLLWLLVYGTTRAGGVPAPDLRLAPRAAVLGLTNVWSSATLVPGAGVVILAVIVGIVARQADSGSPEVPLAISGLLAMFFTYALFGYTRSGLGVGAAGASRYVYIGLLMSTPALTVALAWVTARLPATGWLPVLSTAAVLIAVVAVGLSTAADFASSRRALIGDTRDRLVAAAQLEARGDRLLRLTPDPVYDPDVVVPVLAAPSVRRKLPRVVPGLRAVLDARANLQVAAEHKAFALGTPSRVDFIDAADGRPQPFRPTGAGCLPRRVTDRARVEVPVGPEGAQLELTFDRAAQLSALLTAGRTKSSPVPIDVPANKPVFVGTTAGGTKLVIRVPKGVIQICGPGGRG